MKKNVGSQLIGAQMVNASNGSAFTGTATVVITGDGGTQGASGGTGPTHEGAGYHSYIPTQAETNYDIVAFTFTGSGAIPVTVQVFTTFPQTADHTAGIAAIPTTMRGTDDAATESKQNTMQAALDTVTKAGPTRVEATADKDAILTRLGTPADTDIATDIAAVKADGAAVLARLLTMQVEKNATYSNFEFLMVLTSDHVTPATGLTVTGQRSIDGGAFASVTGTITEVSNGIYQFDAVAADTNGDRITWRFSAGTADDTFVTFNTVS